MNAFRFNCVLETREIIPIMKGTKPNITPTPIEKNETYQDSQFWNNTKYNWPAIKIQTGNHISLNAIIARLSPLEKSMVI